MYYKSMVRILTIEFQAGAGAGARSCLRHGDDDEACETEAYGHPRRSFAYFASFEKVSRSGIGGTAWVCVTVEADSTDSWTFDAIGRGGRWRNEMRRGCEFPATIPRGA